MKQTTVYYSENRIFKFTSQYRFCIESEEDLMILFSLHNRTFQKTYQTGDWSVMDWEPGAFTELQD